MSNRQVMKLHSESLTLEYVVANGSPWLKCKEAASMLNYQNTAKAIQDHAHADDEIKAT